MTLKFINAKKRVNDTIVFPSTNLTIEAGQVVAIYSSVNVREQLLKLFIGKETLSSGDIVLNENSIQKEDERVSILFLDEGIYERLTVLEILKFTKRLYASSEDVSMLIPFVQLEAKKNKKLKELTFSEQKRLQFAIKLIENRDMYILEEADQNLDLESKQVFYHFLHKLRESKKVTLLLTSNLKEAVAATDYVYQLDYNGLQPIPLGEDEEESQIRENSDQIQFIKVEKIPTKVNDKIILFNPQEIDYIESSDGQSFLHIQGEAFSSVFTLKELEDRLSNCGFFRCHRSYIVNLQKVREVITWTRNSYSLVLEDKEKSPIPLSKSKMAELKGMLGMK